MAIRYYVGGSGSPNTTTHWSTVSGGTSGASIPTANDDVVFDENSFTGAGQTVIFNNDYVYKSVTIKGVQYNPTFQISGGRKITAEKFSVVGDLENKLLIRNITVGQNAIIECDNYQVNFKHVILENISTNGSAQFNAIKSTDGGGNSGWNFVDSVKTGHLAPVTDTVAGLITPQQSEKLKNIEENANNYIHPATHSPSEIATDGNNRFVTDSQITSWDAKANATDVYTKTETYTKTEVDQKVADVVNSAPETLDTLNELAQALGDDPNFATTVSNQIGTKLNASEYTATDVLNKLKTVDGTGSGLDADTVRGKIPTDFATSGHTHPLASGSNDGLMSIAQNNKLAGLSNFVHDPTHPSTMITLTTTNFNNNLDGTVTDVQKLADAVDNLDIESLMADFKRKIRNGGI